MYSLEIETEKRIKIIMNPRKARAFDLILRCFVKVMDGEGKWHLIGHCFHMGDAEEAADDINEAIQDKNKFICLEELR